MGLCCLDFQVYYNFFEPGTLPIPYGRPVYRRLPTPTLAEVIGRGFSKILQRWLPIKTFHSPTQDYYAFFLSSFLSAQDSLGFWVSVLMLGQARRGAWWVVG